MADKKFSAFTNGSALQSGDEIVGLRGGANYQFDAPFDYLPKGGGTMSGAINMGSNRITNMTDPASAQDAATRAYVDASGFAAAFARWADPSGSNSNSGKQNAPYLSVFYGHDNNTGTASFPKLIIGNIGNYVATSLALRPNVWLMSSINADSNATAGNVWSCDTTITLDSSWTSAGAGSASYLQNIKWHSSTVFDLDFSGATNGVAINFINNTIGLSFNAKGATSNIPNVNFFGGDKKK